MLLLLVAVPLEDYRQLCCNCTDDKDGRAGRCVLAAGKAEMILDGVLDRTCILKFT
jgi:hypothetical protein